MANKLKKKDVTPEELDLTVFMSLMVVLIPILLVSAEFAKIATVDITLPKGRGSQTQTTQVSKPAEENKLILTVLISDSALTIGAANGFLPSIFYKEFHDYTSKINGYQVKGVEYHPDKLDRDSMIYRDMPINDKLGQPFTPQEREEIELVAWETDDNLKFTNSIKGWYSIKDNDLITEENGDVVKELKVGDVKYALLTRFSSSVLAVRESSDAEEDTTEIAARSLEKIEDLANYELRDVSAYDYLKSYLVQIRERYKDVEDRNDLIIAAENQIIYDKIIQIMDVARGSNLPNISIAKLRL
jgi:biopolymer transport protein ExbD